MNILHISKQSPFFLPSPFAFIPDALSNRVIIGLFNQIFEEAIVNGDLDFLNNNWVLIQISDLRLSFVLSLQNKTLIYKHGLKNPDLVISAKSCDFLAMVSREKDPDTLFFQRKIKMQGSTELGLYVKNFLDAFDVESHWFSHGVDKALQKTQPWLKKLFCQSD